jgi:hypothetical protein
MCGISQNLGVRLWAAGFGLLCLAFVACAPNDVVPNRVAKRIIQPDCMAGCQVYTDDPHPDSVGVWMGVDFTSAACFGGAFADNDGDGMGDQCEWALAKRFAPIMVFDPNDQVGREPYWVARGGNGLMVIGYLPAYYADLGCNSSFICGDFSPAHLGDFEAILVELEWHAGSQHWVVGYANLSQHTTYGYFNKGANAYPTALEYPSERGGPFLVHVAYGKHANYASRASCNAGPDHCNNALTTGDTLYAGLERNLGSASHKFHDCVRSVADPYDDYVECFWSGSYFAGWQGVNLGDTASPYSNRLQDFGFIF